jgi:hypothetical protein
MASTYELRKALYKTIEDTAPEGVGTQAQIISFEGAFAVELYIELELESDHYKFVIEVNSDGKYSVNLINFDGSATFGFAVNGNKVFLKSGINLNGMKVRKEIKYGVINNPSIVTDTNSQTWINVNSAYTTQLENLQIDKDLNIDGTLDVTGMLNADGGIAVDENKFTVASANGNTEIAGTLDVTGILNADGGIAVDENKFTVASANGNTEIAGTLGVTGKTTLSSILEADGGITVDDEDGFSKFKVEDGTGNTEIDGTLGVTGILNADGGIDVNNASFKVFNDGETGIGGPLSVTGILNANGGIAVDEDKFTVASANGNTEIAGTLSVVGITTFSNSDENSGTSADDGAVKITNGGLGVNGNVYIGGNLYFPSDVRLKTKIEILSSESVLESVLKTSA